MESDGQSQTGAVAAAAREFLPIFQNYDVFAAVAGLQLFDAPNIDDGGTVDADKLFCVKSFREAGDPLPHQISVLG